MLDLPPSRTLPLLAAASVTVLTLLGYDAPTAVADSSNGQAVCRGSVESGVEVDTCTGNPNPRADAGPPGGQVRVVPEFCFGFGFGGCDD